MRASIIVTILVAFLAAVAVTSLVAGSLAGRQAADEYDSLVASCERGNVIRAELNARSLDIELLRDRIIGNLRAAVEADAEKPAAVEVYRDGIAELKTITPSHLPIEKCAERFPAP